MSDRNSTKLPPAEEPLYWCIRCGVNTGRREPQEGQCRHCIPPRAGCDICCECIEAARDQRGVWRIIQREAGFQFCKLCDGKWLPRPEFCLNVYALIETMQVMSEALYRPVLDLREKGAGG